MARKTDGVPNPKRVAAGRRNRRKWKGLTPEGRQRLREAAHRNRPWEHTTGPRTPEGKAKVALNGKKRQTGAVSRRELRNELCDIHVLLAGMAASRLKATCDE